MKPIDYIQRAKQQVAEKRGFKDWDNLIDKSMFTQQHLLYLATTLALKMQATDFDEKIKKLNNKINILKHELKSGESYRA